MALASRDNGIERSEKKWGKEAIAAGFTVLPNHLLGINAFLSKERKVSPTEMLVLLQLLLAWWSADRMPFPSKALIALRTGLSPRQVQRALSSLEAKNYIIRVARTSAAGGRASNQYDLSALAALVKSLADENPAAFKRTPRPVPE